MRRLYPEPLKTILMGTAVILLLLFIVGLDHKIEAQQQDLRDLVNGTKQTANLNRALIDASGRTIGDLAREVDSLTAAINTLRTQEASEVTSSDVQAIQASITELEASRSALAADIKALQARAAQPGPRGAQGPPGPVGPPGRSIIGPPGAPGSIINVPTPAGAVQVPCPTGLLGLICFQR